MGELSALADNVRTSVSYTSRYTALAERVSEPRLQRWAVSDLTTLHHKDTLWHKVSNLDRAK